MKVELQRSCLIKEATMKESSYGELVVHTCSKCGGLLLSSSAFKQDGRPYHWDCWEVCLLDALISKAVTLVEGRSVVLYGEHYGKKI